MCGLGVTFDTRGSGRAQPWAVPTMRHRGPDAEAALALPEHDIVVEHCRLAIIDPDNPQASQPFTDPSGRYVLVYNGEVFNFRELRGELARRGVRFETESDTEVVLHAYLAYGEAAFARLRGMFALVIADRHTGELVAARDQIGVKPLYWAFRDGVFVAASEMRTMLAHPALSRELDPSAVVEYLAFGHANGERTLVAGMRQLEPGHLLRVRGANVDVEEYWDVLDGGAPPAGTHEEELRRLLDEAVAASLVSDVPVSMMLSGGLDSAVIAALAARHCDPARLTAYSVSFGLPSDESGAAAQLAGDLGIRHRDLRLTHEAMASGFDDWLATMDLPSANPTWIAVSHIARAVREDGGKVLLSGDGGDELFGGYSRWMTYLRFHQRWWRRAPRPLRRVGGFAARRFAGGLAGDIARRASENGDLFVGSRPFHDDDLARSLGPVGREAAAAWPPERGVVELRRRYDERAPNGDYLGWMSYVAVKRHLLEDYLTRLDRMGMTESVEGRVPLLDPELVRWAFRLPQELKVPGYEQKALFRRAVSPLLPSYIIERPKQGFCPPVADWAAPLLAHRLTTDSILVREGLLAKEAIEPLRAGRSDNASFSLWTAGTLSAWCERNL